MNTVGISRRWPVRTGMSCVGAALRTVSANEQKIHRLLRMTSRRYAPPCPAVQVQVRLGLPERLHELIQRADMAVIGTWRDDMKVDQKGEDLREGQGRKYVIDNVINCCPTRPVAERRRQPGRTTALHALHQRDDQGAHRATTRRHYPHRRQHPQDRDTMGNVVVPFKKLETNEDYEDQGTAHTIIDF